MAYALLWLAINGHPWISSVPYGIRQMSVQVQSLGSLLYGNIYAPEGLGRRLRRVCCVPFLNGSLHYVDDISSSNVTSSKAYWANTSSNDIVKRLVEDIDSDAKDVLEDLIAGEVLEVQLHENITYGDITKIDDNIWNFLFLRVI